MVLPSTAIRRGPSFVLGVNTTRIQTGKKLSNLSVFIDNIPRRNCRWAGLLI